MINCIHQHLAPLLHSKSHTCFRSGTQKSYFRKWTLTYLEMWTESVEECFTSAIVMVTKPEGMSSIRSKYLSEKNYYTTLVESAVFKRKTPKDVKILSKNN